MIFEIWLNIACSSGFKWEKSSSGSVLSVSDCSTALVKVSPLSVEDRLVGSKAFKFWLLVRPKVKMSLLQVGFKEV